MKYLNLAEYGIDPLKYYTITDLTAFGKVGLLPYASRNLWLQQIYKKKLKAKCKGKPCKVYLIRGTDLISYLEKVW